MYKKRSIKNSIKAYKKLNWKFFFRNWNLQTQRRERYDVTRVYLLNSKLWYFQKKKFTQLPLCWKKNFITPITPNIKYNSLVSKIKWF